MIYLFTDFGYQGPYVGELKAVLECGNSSKQPIIDLMHDAPAFNPEVSSYLLAALSKRFEPGDACLGVVDPGVGNQQRLPIIVEADGVIYCGPDNGLFSQIINNASVAVVNEIIWRPQKLSNSFHGRDLFAPALLKVLNNEQLDTRPLKVEDIIGWNWPADLDRVIYIDHFGNLVTGQTGETVKKDQKILLANYEVEYADTFSSQPKGQPFWYVNSMGLIEIAVNQQRADKYFAVNIGAELSVIN